MSNVIYMLATGSIVVVLFVAIARQFLEFYLRGKDNDRNL